MVILDGLKAEQPSDRQCISILSAFSRSFDNPYRSIVRIARVLHFQTSALGHRAPRKAQHNLYIDVGNKRILLSIDRVRIGSSGACLCANYRLNPFAEQLWAPLSRPVQYSFRKLRHLTLYLALLLSDNAHLQSLVSSNFASRIFSRHCGSRATFALDNILF